MAPIYNSLSLFLCVGFRCFPPKFLSWIVFLLGLHVDQKVHPRQRWSLILSSCRLKRQSGAIPCLNLPMVRLAQMSSIWKSKRKGEKCDLSEVKHCLKTFEKGQWLLSLSLCFYAGLGDLGTWLCKISSTDSHGSQSFPSVQVSGSETLAVSALE